MARKRKTLPGPPPLGGYEFEVMELGPAVYLTPPPTAKAKGGVTAAGDGEGLPPRPAPPAHTRTPLVVALDEVAALPRLAREAFVTRCEQRVPPGAVDPTHQIATAIAHYLFITAKIDTPLTAQLRCIRRDFARLKRLAREQKWTDDTPVPPDVFGPMWPPGVEPYWAVEAPPAPPAAG